MRPGEEAFLAHALRLGARGNGQTWPNPSVGCLLVKDGRIVARAVTAPGGRPHAETQALARAGGAARGSTAFVSLEPCAHEGTTPSCAAELAKAGVACVVTAVEDPDPRTAGAGHARLHAAGVEVVPARASEAAQQAHRGFFSRIERGRPWLTLKLATSADGRIATATGESRWITGPSARCMVHAMRARADAVLVGGGTARADDPALTVRGFGEVSQPVRIVASRRLDLPEDGRLSARAGVTEAGPLWLCHGPDATEARRAFWRGRGATMLDVPIGSGPHLDPNGLLRALGERGLGEVLCEGGGAFAASLLGAGLVDELVTFTAGLTLGAEGKPGLGALGIDRLAEAPRFALVEERRVGPDVRAVWRPV
ncbi:MAG: bifunctional diaminohydroxyphosphoribosylaminopyrimidine deaminase/5-amino-6-(5-phosphoribosylamino)uracil reductase RibD [Pseudomonadota bacterium]